MLFQTCLLYTSSFLLYWQFFYVWLFMNCSESALHIKSSRKCPIHGSFLRGCMVCSCALSLGVMPVVAASPAADSAAVQKLAHSLKALSLIHI